MTSPKHRLADAIEAWRSERARERIARWRGDPDALTDDAVQARHARLRGDQAIELLEEAADRGDVDDGERAQLEAALSDARTAPLRAASRAKERALWESRAAYDSDHFEAGALLSKVTVDPSDRRRRAIGVALEPTLREIGSRRAELAAQLAQPPTSDDLERAEIVLGGTADAWVEVWHRVAHAAQCAPEHWTDLTFALRAVRWDDAVKPAGRWRRLAAGLGELAFPQTLARAVKVEGRRSRPFEFGAELALVNVPRDVRIGPGVERGAGSERDAAGALGRAVAAALTHPAGPPHLRRPADRSIGRSLGALLAHVLADPAHLSRSRDLSPAERRHLGELWVALELVELRTAAACVRISAAPEAAELAERAVETLRAAWAIDDVSPGLATTVGLARGAATRLWAAAAAPTLFMRLRERFDADFWRNPAAVEPIRAAAVRPGGPGEQAWLEELDGAAGRLGDRFAELL